MAKNAQKNRTNNNAPKAPEQMSVEEMRSAVPGRSEALNDAGELSADGADMDMDQTTEEERAEKAALDAEAAEFKKATNLRNHFDSVLVPVLRKNLLAATVQIPGIKTAAEAALRTPEIQAAIMKAILPTVDRLYFGDAASEVEPDLSFRGELDRFGKADADRLEALRKKRDEAIAALKEEFGEGEEESAADEVPTAKPGRPAAAKSSTGQTLNKDGTPRKRRGEGAAPSFADSQIRLMTNKILPALKGKKLNGRSLNDAIGVQSPNEKALVKATLAALISEGTIRHNRFKDDGVTVMPGLAQTYEWTGAVGARN